MNRISIPAEVESALSPQARDTARYICAVPGDDGSCQFEIHAGGADVEIVISSSGEIVSVLYLYIYMTPHDTNASNPAPSEVSEGGGAPETATPDLSLTEEESDRLRLSRLTDAKLHNVEVEKAVASNPSDLAIHPEILEVAAEIAADSDVLGLEKSRLERLVRAVISMERSCAKSMNHS